MNRLVGSKPASRYIAPVAAVASDLAFANALMLAHPGMSRHETISALVKMGVTLNTAKTQYALHAPHIVA